MPRYIDAERFEESLDMMCDAGGILQPITEAVRQFCKKKIRLEPTADVQEVKHGRWIENGKGSLICLLCGGYSALNCFNQHRVKNEYCPDCGAKMDLEVKDNV